MLSPRITLGGSPEEIPEQMPVIISLLSDRGLKFVLFIDDHV